MIRVHVKKWSQLQEIPEFLENLGDYLAKEEAKDRKRRRPGEDADENRTRIRVNSHVANPDPTLQDDFRLISLPISMKTKSQKKGFFVNVNPILIFQPHFRLLRSILTLKPLSAPH